MWVIFKFPQLNYGYIYTCINIYNFKYVISIVSNKRRTGKFTPAVGLNPVIKPNYVPVDMSVCPIMDTTVKVVYLEVTKSTQNLSKNKIHVVI